MDVDKPALVQGWRPKTRWLARVNRDGISTNEKGAEAPVLVYRICRFPDQAAFWVISSWAGIGAGKPAAANDSRIARLPSKYTCQ